MSAKQAWVNNLTHTRLVILPYQYYEFPDYGNIPDAHPIHKHLEAIEKAITAQNSEALADLFNYELQCSRVLDSQITVPDENDQEQHAYYQITTRPFLEGLLMLNRKNFLSIVKMIADQDNINLTYAFLDSLKDTSLSKKTLFNWNYTWYKNTTDRIHNLYVYGDHLKKQGLDKGKQILRHCKKLTPALQNLVYHTHCEEKPRPVGFVASQTHQKSLRNLQFKLEFCELLHKEDQSFNQHREYIKYISEIFVSVLTLGILNLANYMLTGNFKLFGKTETQARVEQVESTVRPYHL